MAVLSRQTARHVRRLGEAIAIVDLDEGGRRPADPRSGDRVSAALAVAVAVLGIALLGTLRAVPVPARAPAVASATPSARAVDVPAVTPVPVGWWTYLSGQQLQLVLPADAGDVVLTSIPDRYLNDPLPAVFRVPVSVRGTTGIAAVGPPASLVWTEGDLSYSLSSPSLTVPQLVDLASALR